jgi:methionine sulfoxide reductase heme-binding subunit
LFIPQPQQLRLIKSGLFVLALLPLMRLIYLGFNSGLGANPVEFIEHSTGTWALAILLITLSFTPVRLITHLAWPVQLRRMAGLFMFFYACLHIISYVWLDHWFDWSEISKDIIKHPYVLVGFTAFILSIPLAITSNNAMIKKLKQNWKKLHRLVYIIAILAVVHFWWLVKKDIREPLIYAIVLAVLLLIRLYFFYKKRHA